MNKLLAFLITSPLWISVFVAGSVWNNLFLLGLLVAIPFSLGWSLYIEERLDLLTKKNDTDT